MEDYFDNFTMSDFFLEDLRKKEEKNNQNIKIPDKKLKDKDNKS